MGAQESILKSVEVGETYSGTPSLSRIWSIVAPARRFESEHCVVFIKEFDDAENNDEARKCLDCGIQALKALRHPNIVKYLDSAVTSSCACLLVERLQPLEYWLDDGLEKDEILSGLCEIFEAAGLSHNNIGPGAVFIAPDGAWKLGSFECSQRFENCLHWCQTEFAKSAKDDVYIPPEDKQMMYSNVPPYARDAYGLGKLVDYLMPTLQDMLDEDQRTDTRRLIDSLTTEEAAKRPSIMESNWNHVFRNYLYEISNFLRNLPLKSSEEKTVFFEGLVHKLERISPRIVAKRLSRYLLSRFVLLEPVAVHSFLPLFLDFRDDDSGLVSSHLFKQYIVPELRKVFCVHETAVRLALLTYFDRYCAAFDERTLRELVLPELLLGMKDTDEMIVAASLRSLAELVPLLGASAVTGLKHTKCFFEGRPRDIPPVDVSKLTSFKDAFSLDSIRTPSTLEKNVLPKKEDKLPSSRSPAAVSQAQLTPLAETKRSVEKATDLHSMLNEEVEPTVERIVNGTTSHSEEDENPDLDWVDWDVGDLNAPHPDAFQLATTEPLSAPLSTSNFAPVEQASRQEQRKASASNVFKPLGSEYDVLAIEIKAPVSLEEDLFADMAPTISSNRRSQTAEEITQPAKPVSKFLPLLATGDDQDEGWDDATFSLHTEE